MKWYLSMRSEPFHSSHLWYKRFEPTNKLGQVTVTLNIHLPSAARAENCPGLTSEDLNVATLGSRVVIPGTHMKRNKWVRIQTMSHHIPILLNENQKMFFFFNNFLRLFFSVSSSAVCFILQNFKKNMSEVIKINSQNK